MGVCRADHGVFRFGRRGKVIGGHNRKNDEDKNGKMLGKGYVLGHWKNFTFSLRQWGILQVTKGLRELVFSFRNETTCSEDG